MLLIMDINSLSQKRAAAETKFNELAEQKKQIEEELLKLQGEYRSLSSIISELPAEDGAQNEANTIVVEPKAKNAK